MKKLVYTMTKMNPSSTCVLSNFSHIIICSHLCDTVWSGPLHFWGNNLIIVVFKKVLNNVVLGATIGTLGSNDVMGELKNNVITSLSENAFAGLCSFIIAYTITPESGYNILYYKGRNFKKAYDSIYHEALFYKMKKNKVNESYLDRINLHA